jgi:hypothetical protein
MLAAEGNLVLLQPASPCFYGCFSGAGYLIHPRLEIDRDWGGVGGLLAVFQRAVDEKALMLLTDSRPS